MALVENAAEAVAPSYVKTGHLLRIGDHTGVYQGRFTRLPRQPHNTSIDMVLTSAGRQPHGEPIWLAIDLTCHLSMLFFVMQPFRTV